MNNNIPFPVEIPELTDIRLTKAEIKLLKRINKRKNLPGTVVKKLAHKFKQDNAAVRLYVPNYLVEWDRKSDTVEIIGRGSLWLEYHRQDFIKDHLSKIISLILSGLALVVSIISLIRTT